MSIAKAEITVDNHFTVGNHNLLYLQEKTVFWFIFYIVVIALNLYITINCISIKIVNKGIGEQQLQLNRETFLSIHAKIAFLQELELCFSMNVNVSSFISNSFYDTFALQIVVLRY